MKDISTPNAREIRGYVMLMMQRADGGTTPPVGSENNDTGNNDVSNND